MILYITFIYLYILIDDSFFIFINKVKWITIKINYTKISKLMYYYI